MTSVTSVTERAARPLPGLGRAGTVVDARAADLQRRFHGQRRDSAAVAALARLRRGVGKKPGDVLDILEFTLPDEPGRGAAASYEEDAIHTALTLYALHQQSQGERMHQRGRGLGAALRALHKGDDATLPEPLRRRFQVLGTAESFTEVTHHLRGAVQVLRAAGVPLDYGLLADQLVDWRHPGGPSRVRLRWGRDFYRIRRPDTPAES